MAVFCAMAAVAALMAHPPEDPTSVMATDANLLRPALAQPATPLPGPFLGPDPAMLSLEFDPDDPVFPAVAQTPDTVPAQPILVPTPGTAALAALAGVVLVLPRKRS